MSEMRRAGNALTDQDKTDIRRDIGLGTAATADIPSSGNATSSQVVRGNDTRLSDSREWSAATVDQAEAEAGTATTRRAWTALRVWQAITKALGGVTVTNTPTTGQVLKATGATTAAWGTDETGGGGGATNLAYTASPTGGTVTSDTGTDATIPLSDGTNAGLNSPAQHLKLDGIEAGATANSTDEFLVDRANHTGNQPISSVTGLQTALDGKLSSTDPSVTNAREWTAETISQAEAEAGTATTRRAFTALRVFQAVAAWWQSISTAAGRALVTASDAASQRSALGLGTAATTASTDYATAAQGAKADTAAQIAGDLSGTAAAPVVAKINGVAVTGTPTAGQAPIAISSTEAAWGTVSGGGSPAGSGTELQFKSGTSFGAVTGSSFSGSTLRLPGNVYLNQTHDSGMTASTDGFIVTIRNRYPNIWTFAQEIAGPFNSGFAFGAYEPYVGANPPRNAAPTPHGNRLNAGNIRDLGLWGCFGGGYAASSMRHHGTGIMLWAGYGASPTDTNANGGDAGHVSVWLNPGGAGKGTGVAGAPGRFRVMNDATDAEVWSVDQLGVARQTVPGRKAYATVGTLPSASATDTGEWFVSDSSVAASGNFGAVVSAGGSNKVPVYSDGTDWRIG